MSTIELSALRSDDPLGFLAALGVLELSTTVLGMQPRLGWEGVGGPAVVEIDADLDLDGLADALARLAAKLHADGCLLPGTPDWFPLREGGRRWDPMRMGDPDVGDLARQAVEEEIAGRPGMARWFAALVNQLAVNDKDSGERELTPFYAPAGKMRLSQLFGDALDLVVKDSTSVRQALTGWVRKRGFTGANLDHRALQDAAFLPGGKADNLGVPGATWLALMGIASFRLVGNGRWGEASLWQRVRDNGRRAREFLVWPVWRQRLDQAAVVTLVEHPLLRLDEGLVPAARSDRREALRALGVEAVFAAPRLKLAKSDGPLGPSRLVWPT